MQDIQQGDWKLDTVICRSNDTYLSTMCTKIPKRTAFEATQGRKFNASYKSGRLWGPSSCSLQVYSPRDAQELLSRTGGFMVVGESVERHVGQAFLNVLTGDFESSAISHVDPKCAPSDRKKWTECYDPDLCHGEMQFSEKVR